MTRHRVTPVLARSSALLAGARRSTGPADQQPADTQPADRQPADKQTRARARAVGAGVAGAGLLATGVATAAPAHADVWDDVARCESSHRWDVNTGNGYYGGLQFRDTTWWEFGGAEFAAYAHQATKEQQIAIARRVLAGQGPGAWPVCSKRAGLTRDNGGASATAVPVLPPAPPAPVVAPAPAPPAAPVDSGRVVTVRAGDTLTGLAKRHRVSGGWPAIFALNRGKIANPRIIYVGQQLRLPA